MAITILLDDLIKFWVKSLKYFLLTLQIGEIFMPLPEFKIWIFKYFSFFTEMTTFQQN